MKRIIFLIIASLLVVGLVLPGCAPPPTPEAVIRIAVAGPMYDKQGINHRAGAEMARDEINVLANKVNVGGTPHKIVLEFVDTNEVHGTPADGVGALSAVIGNVDFVVGGFRTENVFGYRDVAMDAGKIFMNCGAATAALQASVFTNYTKYKYWFKATPYNEIFLVTSLLKMMGTIGGAWRGLLNASDPLLKAEYKLSNAVDGKPRVALLIEAATWADGMVPIANTTLPRMGYNVTGTWRPSPTAVSIEAELTEIEATKPHIIFTVLSGPVGITYARDKAIKNIPGLSIGINVEIQTKGGWTGSGGGCLHHIILDTWAEDMAITNTTVAWFNRFVAKTADYPLYTAATYDAIWALKEAIEAVSAANGWNAIANVTAPGNIDKLIQYIETTPRTGVGATTAYYPAATINLTTTWALNASQAYALYPHLPAFFGFPDFATMEAHWIPVYASNFTIPGGHIIHDTVYGPGYQTGIGSQWQMVGNVSKKVGVWPMVVTAIGANKTATALNATEVAILRGAGLLDRYGNWNFAYPGTMAVNLTGPLALFLASP